MGMRLEVEWTDLGLVLKGPDGKPVLPLVTSLRVPTVRGSVTFTAEGVSWSEHPPVAEEEAWRGLDMRAAQTPERPWLLQ